MPRIVGAATRVVDTGKLAIDELAGNVASKSDRISIAHVRISEPTGEPWLTLHYDEWMCLLKGRVVIHHSEGERLEVLAGQTVMIEKGERFRPEFPEDGTEYVPICLPAFRPDRCIREDDPSGTVSEGLRALHGKREVAPEVLYHMCQRSLWEEAKNSDQAYFPPTFEADGFTHATAVPSRLIDTANHFYQDVEGDWVCLRFRRSALRRLGIVTRDELAMPVGEKSVSDEWAEWICPHVLGGLPPQVVDAEFPMMRDGARYTVIDGLTDMPRRIFKLATADEASAFRDGGKIASGLDRQDGFVHLSDRTAPPKVASLFFTGCKDLRLLELDAKRLAGPVNWIVGKMGDSQPDDGTRAGAATTVHYLKSDGCVHVYADSGVSVSAVIREEAVPLGEDGAHVFPEWL
eukprot:CAMPEP_0197880706 /NCGR_PEP_ID=MMETSP1439-20131203/8418_1 /TAXON_ID=66791 /ORGANISM="Gonyaulax spinifera, Strain CCMP409" /LENGTH=404 /DNA_ID=CAMNT_0043500269 /DNA_START=60 /DNA_END=1274 /DNA_ORIENTATION=-